MRIRAVVAVVGLLICVTHCAPRSPKLANGLDYLVIPRDEFGVGTIIQGRGNSLDIDFWPDESVPTINDLHAKGVVKSNPYPTEFVRHSVHQYTMNGLWKKALGSLGLNLSWKKARKVKLTVTNGFVDEVSLETLRRWWPDRYSATARKALLDSRDPKSEIVYRALRCDELQFEFLDETDTAISVNIPARPMPKAAWLQKDQSRVALKSPVWVAFKTAVYLPDGSVRTIATFDTAPHVTVNEINSPRTLFIFTDRTGGSKNQ